MSGETSAGSHAQERRLAAIMFTDVTGYSARMQSNEEGTLELVRADIARMREICAPHGGEVLATMGDGMLVCFSSTVRAVACALQIQAEFGERREGQPPEKFLEHRIGIHLGDVFAHEGNVAGDGVNIAARLQTKAPPGGICISQTVHDTVKGKLAMQAVFIGPHSFKNIQEPIPIYHLSPAGGPPPAAPPVAVGDKAGGSLGRKGPKRALWAAGAVIVLLAGAAFAVLHFRRSALAAASPQPASATGPVSTAPNLPAPAVSSAAAAHNPTPGQTAELLAKARSFFLGTEVLRENYRIAEGLLKQAVATDPTNAEAWALYSELNSAYIRSGFDTSRERMTEARTQSETAIKLAPNSVEALMALGHYQRLRPGNLLDAEKTFRLAAQKDPNSLPALQAVGEVLRVQGRLEDAAAFFARAASVPGSGWAVEYEEAEILFELRRFSEAESAAKIALAAKPSESSLVLLALIDLGWRGDVALAARHLGEVPPVRRNAEEVAFLTAYTHLLARQSDAAIATLKAYPEAFFTNRLYFGPKAYWIALADQQANRLPEAKADRETALAEIRKRLESAPNNYILHQIDGLLLAQLGRLPEALRDLRLAERRPQRPGTPPAWTDDIGLLLCLNNRLVEGLDRIEHQLAGPSVWPLTPVLLRLDPTWDPLRDKARFQKLLHADGGSLPPAPSPASH